MVTINEQPMVAMTSIDGYLLCGWKGGVSIHWTGSLDWITGLDYWTHL